MEQAQQTMRNKVAICQQRHEDLLADPQWKEVVYNKMDVTHDVLCVVYNPLGRKGELELHDINAYIHKHFGNRVYFYVNKDVEGLKNMFSIAEGPDPIQIEE